MTTQPPKGLLIALAAGAVGIFLADVFDNSSPKMKTVNKKPDGSEYEETPPARPKKKIKKKSAAKPKETES